jgi:hypothetical protein
MAYRRAIRRDNMAEEQTGRITWQKNKQEG